MNNAVAGRSARSYYNEGRFTALADKVVAGDYVLLYVFGFFHWRVCANLFLSEFGHNDGGSLSTTDNLRTDCYGGGTETCISPVTGETVYTYVFYLLQAGYVSLSLLTSSNSPAFTPIRINNPTNTPSSRLITAKGAHLIIASPTPNNLWETGTFSYTAPRFTGYGRSVVSSLGSLASFVDHGLYTANIYESLGATTVDAFYPIDHTHTSPAGANTVAAAFMKGLMCGGSALSAYSKNTTSSIAGSCA